MEQHIFFKQFGIPPQQETQPSEGQLRYNYNCLILEMANNWSFVRWMMYRQINGYLKTVDQLEKIWLDIIMMKKIDVEKYGNDPTEFINDYLEKSPENN